MKKLTVSIDDAANMTLLSRSTIYEMIDKGELVRVKFGRRSLITVESIEATIKSRICNDLDDGQFAA